MSVIGKFRLTEVELMLDNRSVDALRCHPRVVVVVVVVAIK